LTFETGLASNGAVFSLSADDLVQWFGLFALWAFDFAEIESSNGS
jgi:hypothetical protein